MQFKFDLPLPMSVGIAISGVTILVGDWDAGAAPVPADGVVLSTLLVGMVGKNSVSSWWKTT